MNADTSWIWPTLILATAAFAAPYYIARALRKYYAPELDIEFKDKDPYCRHAKTAQGTGPYYCHFVVVNSGRSQADDCEAVLERILREHALRLFILAEENIFVILVVCVNERKQRSLLLNCHGHLLAKRIICCPVSTKFRFQCITKMRRR